ncbi:MAG: NUDIX domain-containing protein [Rhizobiaceae bacterium]|nr:NUDIX domain-containing protein [Rhizobiaceae bacterium]
MTVKQRIRIRQTKTIHDEWASLKIISFDYLRRDGAWQSLQRENYNCGHGATILLYNVDRRTIILTRQFRMAAFTDGYEDLMVETPAGLLDDATPEERIRAETQEETGYRVGPITKVFEAYMSPGALTQKIYCFIGEYTPQDRIAKGGGLREEGEDIEVLEMDFDAAYAMIADGRIQDGKTIMLLQHAALHLFPAR